jgi:hypothetical protein
MIYNKMYCKFLSRRTLCKKEYRQNKISKILQINLPGDKENNRSTLPAGRHKKIIEYHKII